MIKLLQRKKELTRPKYVIKTQIMSKLKLSYITFERRKDREERDSYSKKLIHQVSMFKFETTKECLQNIEQLRMWRRYSLV